MELYPGVKISIGPPIDNGFYYDFDFPDGVTLSDADFERIEAKMREHIKADEPFVRSEMTAQDAIEHFRSEGQDYKVELIEDLVRDNGVDDGLVLRERPVPRPLPRPARADHGRIGAVKLQSLAGAYWRGDSSRPMLTRVYGTAFFKKKDLDEHLERLEQAKARDHRRLGPQLGLFTFCEISPGAAFWLPEGHDALQLARRAQPPHAAERGYVEVKTPQLYESSLCETSGHWGKYKENIFISEYEDREFALKPMNCPGHCHLFGLQRWSYKDLPYRCAEPGLLHRREPGGTLHGLLRVRHFCQDDAHIFCREDQVADEVSRLPGVRASTLRPVRAERRVRAVDAARTTGSAATSSGTRPRAMLEESLRRAATSTRSPRARAPSTRRRSTCT